MREEVNKMFEKKYEFVFLRKEYATLNLVGLIKTNSLNNIIRFKNKSFNITVDKPTFSRLKTKVFVLDFDNGSQLKFEEIQVKLNPKELDLFVAGKLVEDLTRGALSDTKDKIINMIIGGIIGALLSAVIMFLYMNSKIDEIYQNLPILQAGAFP